MGTLLFFRISLQHHNPVALLPVLTSSSVRNDIQDSSLASTLRFVQGYSLLSDPVVCAATFGAWASSPEFARQDPNADAGTLCSAGNA